MSDTRVKGRLEYVLGGTPLGVVIRLLVMSFVVGLVLTVLDVNPNDIILWIEDRLRFLTSFGFETFEEAGGTHFSAIPCLNDSDAAIDMLEALVTRELGGWWAKG